MRNKKYRDENRKKRNAQKREYYRENKKRLVQNIVEYRRKKLKKDPAYRMMHNLRRRLQLALKSQGVKKDINSKKLFGADQETIWKHLESKFKKGMTRKNNNLKGWHVDHIKPMSSFDLSDPSQLRECNHYTNLQPLWWWENIKKGNKINKKQYFTCKLYYII